jgi:hypothetical protein
MMADRSKSRGGARSPSVVTVGACAVLSATGVFITLGCLLAIYIESSGGFLGSTEGPGYMASLIIGALAGVVVPAVVCVALLRTSQRLIVGLAALVTAVVTVAMLGILGT